MKSASTRRSSDGGSEANEILGDCTPKATRTSDPPSPFETRSSSATKVRFADIYSARGSQRAAAAAHTKSRHLTPVSFPKSRKGQILCSMSIFTSSMSIFTSMLDVDYKHDQYEHDSEDEHTEALAKHISERISAPTGDEGPYESEASVNGELASQSQAQAIQARSSSVVDVYGKPASQSQARAIQARSSVVEHECRARMHSRC